MKILVAFLVVSMMFLEHLSTASGDGGYKRVCYFENWARYRPGQGKMTPEDIDPSVCTHIMYSFAVLNPTTLQLEPHDAWADINGGGYKKVTQYKNQGSKVMIALGGWGDSSGNKYSRLVSDSASRKKFIDNVITFIETHNFDGLDLDWEFPGCWQANCNAGPASDKENFALWAKELSAVLKPKGLLLSAAVSASRPIIDKAYDLHTIGKYLDFINVMAYDFHGYYEKKTGHHSPLYHHVQDAKEYLNTEYCLKHMHEKGAPKEKLIMGMPMYGQSFTLASSSNNGLNAAATGAGNAGPFTRQAGMLAYNEICYLVKHEQWSVKQQSEMGPYAFKGNQWVGYDDVDMIKKKSQYVKDNGYGGGMVWAMGLDDFNNRCGDGRYPLLNAIKDVLGSGSPPINPTTTKGSHGGEETTTTTYEQTTTKTPNETTGTSGGGNCRVTDAYKSFPGMLDWCITTCATGYCPATHCICKN